MYNIINIERNEIDGVDKSDVTQMDTTDGIQVINVNEMDTKLL